MFVEWHYASPGRKFPSRLGTRLIALNGGWAALERHNALNDAWIIQSILRRLLSNYFRRECDAHNGGRCTSKKRPPIDVFIPGFFIFTFVANARKPTPLYCFN
jgi:hypothetical protein